MQYTQVEEVFLLAKLQVTLYSRPNYFNELTSDYRHDGTLSIAGFSPFLFVISFNFSFPVTFSIKISYFIIRAYDITSIFQILRFK